MEKKPLEPLVKKLSDRKVLYTLNTKLFVAFNTRFDNKVVIFWSMPKPKCPSEPNFLVLSLILGPHFAKTGLSISALVGFIRSILRLELKLQILLNSKQIITFTLEI